MATKDIKSINLLPEFLKTEKNSKFLASTLDQLINPAQLERIEGYIGSTITPNYVSTSDIYISETTQLRRNYQLEPACVFKDSLGTVNDVIGIDDLTNEIVLNGGYSDNFDRLYRSNFYSYDPHIDWDKFVNYQNYYWLVNGPDNVVIDNIGTQVLNIETNILTTSSYTYNGINLLNGMKVRFLGNISPESYREQDFFVEGVGSKIKLIPYTDLDSSEDITTLYIEHFDATPFDEYPFDGYKNLPENIEYVTINRASKDLNSWSRYNRWVHKDVIRSSAAATGQQPVYSADKRAKRPIIEFKADLKLYNYGSIGIPDVDLIDTKTKDVFSIAEGSAGYYVDGVLLEQGHKVIFAADTDSAVRDKIYQVNYIVIQNTTRLTLEELIVPATESVTSVVLGKEHAGTSWWYNGDTWVYAQQHTAINQAPLFDLFDNQGHSYSDVAFYKSNFVGNKIFGYEIGTIYDPILQLKIKYRNSVGTGSYLFKNYFMSDTISISVDSLTTEIISTGIAYCKFGDKYVNVWSVTDPYPIPTLASPETGDNYYASPLGLTNNPLNGPIASFTLSEIADHVTSSYRRLISNINPLAFAQIFIGKKEHNLIDALDKAAEQYNQYKLAFLRKIAQIDNQTDPIAAVDQVLNELNADKDTLSSYYLSDMTPYGTDKIVRIWTVTSSRNKIYPITSDYDPTALSMRAVLVYLNGVQLIRDIEYQFEVNDSSVRILVNLAVGDTIVINDYTNTIGNFVPSTPTKLGLYPKYVPAIFNDSTYVDQDIMVIQGHDGSLMIAYNDYRDDIILEFEKRIFNNIKVAYRKELLDYNTVIPGAFRTTQYSDDEVKGIITGDFNNWAGQYGIEITNNSAFDEDNPYTWNYTNTYSSTVNANLTGSWRAVYKYFYDTDRPHSHPWEMLGYTEKPNGWDLNYSWIDPVKRSSLINVITRGSLSNSTNSIYARPGFSSIVPVDAFGDLLDPTELIVQTNSITPTKIRSVWEFNQQGPAETAWRRSSYWPFVLQKLLALTRPADYAALLYDPIRLTKNIAGQWTYGNNYQFLSPAIVKIHGNESNLTTGYSVFVSENGRSRTGNYIQELKSDLNYLDFNLFYKVGGFISKNKMQIIIDAIDPTSSSSGAILPPEDYNLILNTSNPVKTTAISGIIVQKSNGKFIVRGYDNSRPYFNIYPAVRNATTPAITVGGVSQPYVLWKSSSSGGSTGLTDADTTTAQSATGGVFYQVGQIVSYGDRFYRVKINHKSGDTFNSSYFQILPSLPINGGVSVQTAIRYDKVVVQVPYGKEFDRIQEVYDLIVGYGAWLEDQGFIFDQFNNDLQVILDWKFSGNEFLFWTTQNWADNSVITLSPFADQVKFYSADSIVDNIFDKFYHRSVLQVNGKSIRPSNLSVNRDNGVCTIRTSNTLQGIYFAMLNNVQKEHAIVFNNTTIFNDTIYDIETGYRQRRMKLVGFRTANWNGDYFSPGFVYDAAVVNDWKTFNDYRYADVVRFNGNYYSANKNIAGAAEFDFNKWTVLRSKPTPDLVPNFDYKISQFEDFYSLDIDNFDSAQQKMAQHLTGYTPRVYLNNIFTNPISQYKFYQGYIKEKGTRNSIAKLAKASIHNLQGDIDYTEEWAFRIGHYGSYETFKELEISLVEGKFIENPQIIKFTDTIPAVPNDLIYYSTSTSWSIIPTEYVATSTFVVTPGTDIFQLPIAGYVNFDDVDYTAYNEGDILSILNSSKTIKRGDTVWIAAKKNNDWGVARYTLSTSRIIGAMVESGTTGELTLITDNEHSLVSGDVISIYKCDSRIDGIYIVKSITNITAFVIEYSNPYAITELASIGLLFKFVNARYNLYDELPSDNTLLQFPVNTKLWVDDDGTGSWVVYQKVKNYNRYSVNGSNLRPNEKLGWSLTKAKNSNIFMVGAPGYQSINNTGTVFVYTELDNSVQVKIRYSLNASLLTYHVPGGDAEFGYSLAYDDRDFIGAAGSSGYGLFFAGAPGASRTKSGDPNGDVRYSTGIEPASLLVQEGLVKISAIDPVTTEEYTQRVLLSPRPSNFERFGHSIYIQQTTTDDRKLLLVGAPRISTQGPGNVYAYHVTTSTVNTGTIDLSYIKSVTTSSIKPLPGDLWGHSISGSDNADIIAIGAPGYSRNTGIVSIFTGMSLTHRQDIISPFKNYNKFGQVVKVSSDGSYLFISATDARGANQSYGKVAVYTLTNSLFVLDSILENPFPTIAMKFGQAIDINNSNTELVISAIGKNKNIVTTFDIYKDLFSKAKQPDPTTPYAKDPESDLLVNLTTFDGGSTSFHDSSVDSGSVYIYNRKTNKFRLTYELVPVDAGDGTNYGYSVAVNDNSIYVGAPAYSSNAPGSFHQFYKINVESDSFRAIRKQNQLIDLNTIHKISIIDSFNEKVIDYMDTIDPAKGKIAGQADQDIRYKSLTDPAIYSTGTNTTVNDTDINWLDRHVGELWWDLSTVKYVWYEQGDVTYRKNNWGRVFPGSSIDIYEWVGTPYLPSEWAQLADTVAGLSLGISGQPKYSGDSIVSVKQVYNSATLSFENRYYFWVKNKVTIPDVKNRRITAKQIADIIADPTSYGLKYAAIIDQDAVILSNLGNTLVDNRIHINITSDIINNPIPLHTEWLLLQEGLSTSRPNTLLEKKLFDSLLGHDSLGNPVPDPALSARAKCGISIRPRQTLFKNRFEAIRNIIEFSNSVLITNRITGNYSFANLNKQETVPYQDSCRYDEIVEDNEGLLFVDTRNFVRAEISCKIENGKIITVDINNPGRGYKISPLVKISNNTDSSAEIKTVIDEYGSVIDTVIVNTGSKFTSAPTLEVRSYTVIVLADNENNGKWSEFVYDVSTRIWARLHTQQYNTTLYWEYQDWISPDYNPFIDYSYTVNEIYELESLEDLRAGDYVKVKNGGLGYYIILVKTNIDVVGDFSNQFNIVYSENGTIQILDTVWNLVNSNLNFDEISSYDQTLYDQTPDIELNYILTALKEDLFVNELKINWNLLFFKAVKYALSEQKLLDWAFKTSFINVVNNAGNLDQRSVYKLQNAEYFEDYIKEVKPYHTNIRSFTAKYNVLEPSGSYITDFDLPSYYDRDTDEFTSIEILASESSSTFTITNTLTNVYPWKSWADNYLTSGTVRTNLIGMKFDRISRGPEVDNLRTVDNFICNGSDNSFVLSWEAEPDKSLITIILDGSLVLGSDYSITYYDEDYGQFPGEYRKNKCKILFLNYTPPINQTLTVSYYKKTTLLNAADRILNFYTAKPGMPGLDLGQLMTGIVYPKTQVEGLMFDYTTDWDIYTGYDSSSYADSVGFYTSTTSSSTSSQFGTWTLIQLSSLTGIALGQYVNVSSKLTQTFTTATVRVIDINTLTNVVTFNTTTFATISTGSNIEFWTLDSEMSILDSAIVGGTWNTSTRVGALGINPEDITIDGDGFITPNTSHAPEELVPGEINESLGINVYTKNPRGGPIVLSSYINIVAGSTATQTLGIVPPSIDNIKVTFNNNIFTYITGTNFTTSTYTIDWANNQIIVPPQAVSGNLGYTIVSVGGGRSNKEAGVIDSATVSILGASTVQVQSLSSYQTVKSAYVTLNGQKIESTGTGVYYQLTYASSINRRAAVNVYNLPIDKPNTVTAWFFGTFNKYFNEVREETFPITGSTYYTLSYPPGNIEPVVEQAIVELYDPATGQRNILRPPYVDYYKVLNAYNTTFTINNTGTYSLGSRLRVYVNGVELKPGFEYRIVNGVQVSINFGICRVNDVVAILSKPVIPDYDYDITGNVLSLEPGFPTSKQIKVITYNNHDDMFIRTEQFIGLAGRRYQISRPAVNSNYVWVIVNGIPLVNILDYEILDDLVTVQISSRFEHTASDKITIISISDSPLATTVLGYRVFNDIFNRTHFKRLSKQNTTYLTRPLSFTDTEIHVADTGVLTPPLVAKNMPGVVIIDGERIEFFTVANNTLGQLRRSTLGTAPSFYSEENTKVIDQGLDQTVPYKENIYKQVLLTSASTNTYSISAIDYVANTGTYHQFVNNGIVFDTGVPAVDQVEVNYGGRRLSKVGTFRQDIAMSYDSPRLKYQGTVTSVSLLPATTIIGTGYVLTDTNQVWVYEDSTEAESVNGYIYRGLDYRDPEFTIDADSRQITLNIENGVQEGVKLTLIKREIPFVWNDVINYESTKSLMDSKSTQARFLQARPAELPDKYYYGGDTALSENEGYAITTEDGQPLEGY
jgi:hypothetical protein